MRPARKRELVNDVRTVWKVSIRRACRNLCVDTSSYHYKARRPSQASLRERIKEIAESRVRYGYRRIHVLLRREGWVVNAKRVNRLYREMGLQLRNKSPKRKVKAKLREGRSAPVGSNDVWAMDFMSDKLFDGLPFQRRERVMLRFRRMRLLQKFVAVHSSIYNHFNAERTLSGRGIYKASRTSALTEWRQLCAA